MRKLGLIGGTSYHSTIEYYRYINQMVNERFDPKVSPPLLLNSIDISLMRTQDFDLISQSYLTFSQNLESAGAEAILICANTPHLVVDFVAPKIGIPILHIADAIAKEALKLNTHKLALLGTLPVMEKDFISKKLMNTYNLEVLTPNKENRQELHRIVSEELTMGIFKEETKRWVIQLMNTLKDDGAEAMILGCTELPILIQPGDYDLPLLDTLKLHAALAVDFILGES